MLVLLILCALLAGCGAGAPAIGSASATAVPTLTSSIVITAVSSSAVPATTASAVDVVVTFSRSGGFAGRTETLVIGTGGSMTLTMGGQQKKSMAEPAALQGLKQAVSSAEWQRLQPVYGKGMPDAYVYRVTAAGKTVQTYDGVDNPPLLDQVLQALNSLLARADTAP